MAGRLSTSSTGRGGSKRKTDPEDGDESSGTAKKRRFVWPDDLHAKFVSAVFDVGLRCSSSQSIVASLEGRPELGKSPEEIQRLLLWYRTRRQVLSTSPPVVTHGDNKSPNGNNNTRHHSSTDKLQRLAQQEQQQRELEHHRSAVCDGTAAELRAAMDRAALTARCQTLIKQQAEVAMQSEKLLSRFQSRLLGSVERTRDMESAETTSPTFLDNPRGGRSLLAHQQQQQQQQQQQAASLSRGDTTLDSLLLSPALQPAVPRLPLQNNNNQQHHLNPTTFGGGAPLFLGGGSSSSFAATAAAAALSSSAGRSARASVLARDAFHDAATFDDDVDEDSNNEDGDYRHQQQQRRHHNNQFNQHHHDRPPVVVRAYNAGPPSAAVTRRGAPSSELAMQSEMESHMEMHREMLMRKADQLTLFEDSKNSAFNNHNQYNSSNNRNGADNAWQSPRLGSDVTSTTPLAPPMNLSLDETLDDELFNFLLN